MNKLIPMLIILLFCLTTTKANGHELSKGTIGPLSVGVHIFKLAKYDLNASVVRKQFEEDFYLEYLFEVKGVGSVRALLKEDDKTV